MEIESVKNAAATYQGSKVGQNVKNTSADHKTEAPKENVVIKDPVERPGKSNVQKDEDERNTDNPQAQEQRNAQLRKAVEDINKKSNTEAIFGFHDKTNRVTIKIVDRDTKDVIKEIPPEKTLDMIAKAWELAGLMVDEKR